MKTRARNRVDHGCVLGVAGWGGGRLTATGIFPPLWPSPDPAVSVEYFWSRMAACQGVDGRPHDYEKAIGRADKVRGIHLTKFLQGGQSPTQETRQAVEGDVTLEYQSFAKMLNESNDRSKSWETAEWSFNPNHLP